MLVVAVALQVAAPSPLVAVDRKIVVGHTPLLAVAAVGRRQTAVVEVHKQIVAVAAVDARSPVAAAVEA